MKNKTIVAIWGSGSQGKSETIKKIYLELQRKYSNAKIELINNGFDITVIITIGKIKIGIESQGDPNSRLEVSLNYFVSINCDIIICATRNYGSTVNLVESICNSKKYNLYWATNFRTNDKKNKKLTEELNSFSAKQIIEFIEK